MENGQAERNINITLDKNCLFMYNPLPTIPYAESAMSNSVRVNLSNTSSAFIYSDIMVCGRAARGEKFEYRYYNSLVSIFENDSLTYRDNTRFCPDKMNMSGLGMYEGYTHLLSMVVCNVEVEDSEIFELFEAFETPYGITRNGKNYVVIKALSKTAQSLEKVSDKVRKLIVSNKKYKI
jgi:urease accessory protein